MSVRLNYAILLRFENCQGGEGGGEGKGGGHSTLVPAVGTKHLGPARVKGFLKKKLSVNYQI